MHPGQECAGRFFFFFLPARSSHAYGWEISVHKGRVCFRTRMHNTQAVLDDVRSFQKQLWHQKHSLYVGVRHQGRWQSDRSWPDVGGTTGFMDVRNRLINTINHKLYVVCVELFFITWLHSNVLRHECTELQHHPVFLCLRSSTITDDASKNYQKHRRRRQVEALQHEHSPKSLLQNRNWQTLIKPNSQRDGRIRQSPTKKGSCPNYSKGKQSKLSGTGGTGANADTNTVTE